MAVSVVAREKEEESIHGEFCYCNVCFSKPVIPTQMVSSAPLFTLVKPSHFSDLISAMILSNEPTHHNPLRRTSSNFPSKFQLKYVKA
jgi:hypothetical protein